MFKSFLKLLIDLILCHMLLVLFSLQQLSSLWVFDLLETLMEF